MTFRTEKEHIEWLEAQLMHCMAMMEKNFYEDRKRLTKLEGLMGENK